MRIPIESSTSYRGRNSRPNLPALAVFLLLAFGAGAISAAFSPRLSAAAAHIVASLRGAGGARGTKGASS